MLSFAHLFVLDGLLVLFVLRAMFDGFCLLFVPRCNVCVAALFVMSWCL